MSSLREDYLRDGFAYARGLLPLADLDAATAEMNEVVAQQSRRLGLSVVPGSGVEALYENMRALHAARLMGFLAHPGARVESGTTPGWKRFVSPAGQVFVRTTTSPVRLSVVPTTH